MNLLILQEKFTPDLNKIIGGSNVKKKMDPHYPEPLGTNTGLDIELAVRSGDELVTPKDYALHKRPPESRGDIEAVADRRPTKIVDPPNEQTDEEYGEDEFELHMAKVFGGRGKMPKNRTYLVTSGGDFNN